MLKTSLKISTRVIQIRSEMKKEAILHVPADYKLGHNDTEQVEDLLAGATYIYSRDPRTVCILSHLILPRNDI